MYIKTLFSLTTSIIFMLLACEPVPDTRTPVEIVMVEGDFSARTEIDPNDLTTTRDMMVKLEFKRKLPPNEEVEVHVSGRTIYYGEEDVVLGGHSIGADTKFPKDNDNISVELGKFNIDMENESILRTGFEITLTTDSSDFRFTGHNGFEWDISEVHTRDNFSKDADDILTKEVSPVTKKSITGNE